MQVLLYYLFSTLLIFISVLPMISDQHWFFRVLDFGRIQIMILLLIHFSIGFFIIDSYDNHFFWLSQFLLIAFATNNFILISPYISLGSYQKKVSNKNSLERISIMSINVYQFNKEYKQLIQLVQKVKPDILLTMESNKDWEIALSTLQEEYKFHGGIALENTYGMHFYSNLRVGDFKINYLIADDIPSIEAELTTKDNVSFSFYGIHPPPPSPTEEKTSKERDGELLMLAKKIAKNNKPTIVIGDFNTVAWAKISRLFKKTSKLIDPRVGRGFIPTYHAKYKLLKFPIDLCFHSSSITIEQLKTLKPINSDHLPLFCRFYVDQKSDNQNNDAATLDQEEKKEVKSLIKEGLKEKSNR